MRRGDQVFSGTHQQEEEKRVNDQDEQVRSGNQLRESNVIDNDQGRLMYDDQSLKVSHSVAKKAPIVPPRSIDSQLSRSPAQLINQRPLIPNVHGQVSRTASEQVATSHQVTGSKLHHNLETREDEDESKRNDSTMTDDPCNDGESSVTCNEDKNGTEATTTRRTAAAKGKSKSDSSFLASSSLLATCDLQHGRNSSMHQSKFRDMNKCQCSDKNDTQCQSTHSLLSQYDEMNEVKSAQVTNDADDDMQSDKYDSLGEEINSEDEFVEDTSEHYTFNETVDGESDQVREEQEEEQEEEEEEEDHEEDEYLTERMEESCKARNILNESDSSILRNGNKLKISLHYSSDKSSVGSEVATGRANATSKLFQKNRHTLNRRIGSSHVLQPIYKSSASSTSKSNKIIIDVPGSTSNYLNVSSCNNAAAAATTTTTTGSAGGAVGHTSSPYFVSSSSSSTVSSASSSSGYQGNTFDPYDCSSGSGHEEHIYEELYHIDSIDELTNDLKGIIDLSSCNEKCDNLPIVSENNLSVTSSALTNPSKQCKSDKLSHFNLHHQSSSPSRVFKSHSYTNQMIKSMFDGASKDEILEYIEEAKERVKILSTTSPLSGSSVSSLHLTTFTNSLDRAFYSESTSEEYLHSLTPLTVHHANGFLSCTSAVNLSSGINSSTISSTSSGNSGGSSSGNSSNSSPYTRTKSTPCIVSAVSSSASLLPSLMSNGIHSSSGSSIAGDLSPVKSKVMKETKDAPISAPPRRNRSSNVSNSSTDSAVTTGSSTCDHEIESNYCGAQIILSPPAQFTSSSMDSEGHLTNLPRSISLSHLIERQDSGVGPETCKPNRLRRALSGQSNLNPLRCVDCDEISSSLPITLDQISLGLCVSCEKKRTERKEIISEFVDTEFKYGRDLRIIKDEVYSPIEVAGLMTKDQLKSVFINLEQLISVNRRFAHQLEDSLDTAYESGDEVSIFS